MILGFYQNVNAELLSDMSKDLNSVNIISDVFIDEDIILDNEMVGEVAKVTIPDENLERIIKKKLNISSSKDITTLDMAKFKSLVIHGSGIKSIEGLQYAINLEELDMSCNKINDLSPISKLDKLQIIHFAKNHIKDINVLNNLQELLILGVEKNEITDISVLYNFKKLLAANLQNNKISDISPLGKLSIVSSSINLDNNMITDFGVLLNLKVDDFSAENQNIVLSEIKLGESTNIVIRDQFNKEFKLDFKTPGEYKNNLLKWKEKGNNEVIFSQGENISGSIKQYVR